MANLNDYSIAYSGGLGSAPTAQNFGELGVTAATFVSVAGGGDYAEITVDVDLNATGMPFVPLARHAIYDGEGNLRFVGWLMQPGRAASPNRQTQTFRLEGPNSQLAQKVFQQPWNYAVDPTNYNSTLAPQMIPRALLNREEYGTGARVNVAAQIQAVLDYYIGLFPALAAPIACGSLDAIPAVQPPEDEQTDAYCDTILQRQLRWVPKVTAYWTYDSTTPKLNFSANDAVPAASLVSPGGSGPVGGVVSLPDGQSVLIDPASGTLTSFKSTPRYDLLVGQVTVFYQAEQDITDDGTPTGTRKLWATLGTDVSTVVNGSTKELTYCFDLRGEGGLRDPATGLPETPQENAPAGLAAALHDPFKVLTHSLDWSIVNAEVDWSTLIGSAVGVLNAGDDLLNGSRSIIQRISREIGTGTTTYQAGPPTHLGIDDLIALTRFNRTRNAARNGGGSGGGGYSKAGGPNQQDTGKKTLPDQGGGSGGGGGTLLWWNVAANGVPAFAQFSSTAPTTTLPADAIPVNPN